MKGADLKRLYEWYSHKVTIPNLSLSCIVFGLLLECQETILSFKLFW
jgi:hypothetical protein